MGLLYLMQSTNASLPKGRTIPVKAKSYAFSQQQIGHFPHGSTPSFPCDGLVFFLMIRRMGRNVKLGEFLLFARFSLTVYIYIYN